MLEVLPSNVSKTIKFNKFEIIATVVCELAYNSKPVILKMIFANGHQFN